MAEVKPLKLSDVGGGVGELREFDVGDILPPANLPANLAALSGLTGAADRLPYFTGAGALSLTTLTALARNLLDDTTQSGMQSTLGLVKQTSATDTTAGALMAVGAFGLGGDYDVPNFTGNANNLVTTGLYRASTADTINLPAVPGTYSILVYFCNSGVRYMQQAANQDSTGIRIYHRKFTGTVWTAWVELYHTGNILGTVSQSGGVPTGAIIERGSNANGEYVRWADGTQICTTPLRTGYVAGEPQTYSWPAPFINFPVVSGQSVPSSGWDTDFTIYGNEAIVLFYSVNTLPGNLWNACGIGRWY